MKQFLDYYEVEKTTPKENHIVRAFRAKGYSKIAQEAGKILNAKATKPKWSKQDLLTLFSPDNRNLIDDKYHKYIDNDAGLNDKKISEMAQEIADDIAQNAKKTILLYNDVLKQMKKNQGSVRLAHQLQAGSGIGSLGEVRQAIAKSIELIEMAKQSGLYETGKILDYNIEVPTYIFMKNLLKELNVHLIKIKAEIYKTMSKSEMKKTSDYINELSNTLIDLDDFIKQNIIWPETEVLVKEIQDNKLEGASSWKGTIKSLSDLKIYFDLLEKIRPDMIKKYVEPYEKKRKKIESPIETNDSIEAEINATIRTTIHNDNIPYISKDTQEESDTAIDIADKLLYDINTGTKTALFRKMERAGYTDPEGDLVWMVIKKMRDRRGRIKTEV